MKKIYNNKMKVEKTRDNIKREIIKKIIKIINIIIIGEEIKKDPIIMITDIIKDNMTKKAIHNNNNNLKNLLKNINLLALKVLRVS